MIWMRDVRSDVDLGCVHMDGGGARAASLIPRELIVGVHECAVRIGARVECSVDSFAARGFARCGWDLMAMCEK